MKLNEGQVGSVYRIRDIQGDDTLTRRLEALGVNQWTLIQILNKKGSGSMIIKVRGTRLALGNGISGRILIEEAAENGR